MNEWAQEFEKDWDKYLEGTLDNPRLKEAMDAMCESFEELIDELIEEESKRLMKKYNLSYGEAVYIVLSKLKDAWDD